MQPKPYHLCATRLENRGDHPPTRKYVDELVQALLDSGVEASWHSAVAQNGRPLFPSKVIPNCHPRASFEAFCYLIGRLHEIGRPVLSWYALNHNAALAEVHPDWRTEFCGLESGRDQPEGARDSICFNSPYGELLPHFCVEVVRDVGFDGLWFDGATWSFHGAGVPYPPGCGCAFCRERFRRDTGHELPGRIDWDSRVFREWVNWRYEVLMGVLRRIVAAVHAVSPGATICYNDYRRRVGSSGNGWTTAIPMRRLGLDILMSGELDGFPGQADVQMKIQAAYACARGVESWWPLCDHWYAWVPDTQPLSAVQAALGCISAGGVGCTGVGVPPKQMTYVLREMQRAAAPRMPYVGGETVQYAAIVASQQTMDFYGRDRPAPVWDGIHGANELLRHAHLQSSVVFDDDLEAAELGRCPVVLLGDMACMSRSQAEEVMRYVEAGGVIVACHRVGELDEMGYEHERPVLDGLLGIERRTWDVSPATLEVPDGPLAHACGRHVSFGEAHITVEPAADAAVLAASAIRASGSWNGCELEAGRPFRRRPGLIMRRAGEGAAIYAGMDLFGEYLRAPTVQKMRLLRALVTELRAPAVTLEGPMCVTMNARMQADGRLAVHLHNTPGTIYHYPQPPGGGYVHCPGEVVPVRGLEIVLSGMTATCARSGVSGRELVVEGGTRVLVDEVELHDVVLIELKR